MKRIIFIIMLCVLNAVNVSAQNRNVKLGVHAGLPVGDMNNAYSYNLGGDLGYFMSLAGIIEVGALAGYMYYFADSGEEDGSSWEGKDASYIPVAASGRIGLGAVFAGMDLGYAFGIEDGNDGGFFYRPKIGFGFLGLILVGSYSGISSNGIEVNSINLGLEFSF